MDTTLACLVTWLEGHSLAQTVFTNLYLHSPNQVSYFNICFRSFLLSRLLRHSQGYLFPLFLPEYTGTKQNLEQQVFWKKVWKLSEVNPGPLGPLETQLATRPPPLPHLTERVHLVELAHRCLKLVLILCMLSFFFFLNDWNCSHPVGCKVDGKNIQPSLNSQLFWKAPM